MIPAYNYASYLPRTIGSVLNQSVANLEVIVVDDGSTDDTGEVVSRITDPRLRYVRQTNAGLSAARNTGIREAQHGLIAFLDADDLWERNFLEVVLSKFIEMPSNFALVATHSSRIDAEDRPIPPPKRNWDSHREFTSRDFCLRNRPLSSSIVIRREVFSAIGDFDPSLKSSEDRDLWIRATERGFRFWFIHDALCRIRRHGGNMSKHAPRMRKNSARVLVNAWRRGSVAPGYQPFWGQVFAVHFQQVATTHFEGGYRLRALGYLLASVVCWPFFADPGKVYEPHGFRIRTLWHFLRSTIERTRS